MELFGELIKSENYKRQSLQRAAAPKAFLYLENVRHSISVGSMQRLDALSREETYYSKKNGKFHFFYKRWGKPLPFVPSQEGKLITPSGREISLFYRTLGRLAFEDQTLELGRKQCFRSPNGRAGKRGMEIAELGKNNYF